MPCATGSARGERGISDVVTMRSMLVAPSGERMLVELKAVDGAWPMVGQAVLAPVQPVSEALGDQDGLYGAAAEPLVLDRLGLHAGRQGAHRQ